MRAVEAAVDEDLVPSVRRARRRDDRPLDLARKLAERSTRGVEPETGERADGPGAERDTGCPLQELAPVDTLHPAHAAARDDKPGNRPGRSEDADGKHEQEQGRRPDRDPPPREH